MPVNWSAYEDIAEFFTNDVKEIDGVQVYGHMDYGKRAPDLGWRMTDAWLSMAGVGTDGRAERPPDRRVGHPHGGGLLQPGRRHRSRAAARPTARRRSTPSPSGTSGCASTRLRARPSYDFYQSLPALGQGNVAQQIFWYTAFTAPTWSSRKSEGNNTVDDEGNPLWRMAPSPHGPYWKDGQKLGYQDVGSWTHPEVDARSTARKAAWLYAQFVVSKTVDTEEEPRRPHLHPRQHDPRTSRFTERAPKLGGLVEFYRSPDRVRWSPTGINVPDYPKLAQIWWQQIGDVNSGAFTPQEAMDRLAEEMDETMARMQAGRRSRPTSTAAAARGSTPRRTRPSGSASRTARRPSSRTRSRRARPSPTTSWSSAGPRPRR